MRISDMFNEQWCSVCGQSPCNCTHISEAHANTASTRAGLAKRKTKVPLTPEEQMAKDRAKFERWKAKNQKPKKVNEFAPDDSGDGDNEDALLKYARMWYNGDLHTQQQVEQILDRAGWEIGELESEEGGCFVVRSGDENGNSYIGFAPEDLSEGVGEGEEMGTYATLKGLKSWQVVIMNNYYRGKYSDYSGRYYYVLATSPQEARQVVLHNADAILQELLTMKSHNGKKILPRGSAVRITPERVGEIKDGTEAGRMSTAGFKRMFGPEGPMMVKLSGGAVADIQEQGVAEGSEDIGDTIRALYQKIYDQGDDALEYLNTSAPLFSQYWEQYEGDLDSIIAEASPKNLIRIAKELQAVAGQEGVAEEQEKNPFEKGSMGHALWRDLSKTKKASPQQQQRNRERFAKRDAEKAKQQGVAEMDGDGAGRDGSNRKRIGSYGTRDRDIPGPDIHLGPEHIMKPKDITKRASDVLNKSFGSSDRESKRLWAMITDYEKRAKATKNDIKKAHYMRMADGIRAKLPTTENSNSPVAVDSASPISGKRTKTLDEAGVSPRDWKKQVAKDHGSVKMSRHRGLNKVIARNAKGNIVAVYDHGRKHGTVFAPDLDEAGQSITVQLKDGRHLLMPAGTSGNPIKDVLSYLIRSKDFKTLTALQAVDGKDVQSIVQSLIDQAKQQGASRQNQITTTNTPVPATTAQPASGPAPAPATPGTPAPAATTAKAAAPAPTTAPSKSAPSKDAFGYRSFFKEPTAASSQPAAKGGEHFQGWQDWATRGQQFANKTKQKVTASKTNEPGEADYGDSFQAMVQRVRQLAGEGPRKTVYDPDKRVYKTVPVNPPKDKQ